MTALTLMKQIEAAQLHATVFVLVDGRYVKVDEVVLAGVDPTISGYTSVCLKGEEFIPKRMAGLVGLRTEVTTDA